MRTKKQQTRYQAQFCKLLGTLLQQGFSIQQALDFMPNLLPKNTELIKQMQFALTKGETLANVFRKQNWRDFQVAQIELSQQQGGLDRVLLNIATLLTAEQKRRQKQQELLAYPLFLLLILGFLLMSFRLYLWPQLNIFSKVAFEQTLLFKSLCVALAVLIIGGLIVFIFWQKIRQLPILEKSRRLYRLPVIGNYLQLRQHYFLLFDLNLCLANGLTIHQMFNLMTQLEYQSLLNALMVQLQTDLTKGKPLIESLSSPFYPTELRLLLAQQSSRKLLTKELILLNQWQFEQLQQRLRKSLNWLQPVLFVIIGLMIVIAYLSVLLPIYKTMEGI